jgi:imidazolonepropionase
MKQSSLDMERRILIHGARQLLTLRGTGGARRGHDLSQLHIIEDGAILIGDGRIIEVGPSRRLENLAAAKNAKVIAAHGRVVMPAFIDPDTRSLRALATFKDSFPVSPVGCPCADWTGPAARIRYEGEQILEGMLRHGTAIVETKGDVRMLRIISQMKSRVEVIPTLDAGAGTSDEVLRSVRKQGLARFVQCRAAPVDAVDLIDLDTFERAQKLGFGTRRCCVAANRNCSASLRADTQAVIRTDTWCDEEIAALSASNTVVVLAPGTTFHQGEERYPPARALIGRGAAVALATGYGPSTNPSYSMPVTLSLACRKMAMLPAEAVAAATINAAHALGAGSRAGSLEPGKQADILILETGDYRALPWEFGINLVRTVIKAGEVVYDAGKTC